MQKRFSLSVLFKRIGKIAKNSLLALSVCLSFRPHGKTVPTERIVIKFYI
jgi:hypothetical protein